MLVLMELNLKAYIKRGKNVGEENGSVKFVFKKMHPACQCWVRHMAWTDSKWEITDD